MAMISTVVAYGVLAATMKDAAAAKAAGLCPEAPAVAEPRAADVFAPPVRSCDVAYTIAHNLLSP